MTVRKGSKKRFWSDDEKRSICAQTLAPGVSVAQVARRYSMNSNLIFKWLKDPRFAPPALDGAPSAGDEHAFLPVEIACADHDHARDAAPSLTVSSVSRPVAAHRVDITLSDGRRITVDGPTTLAAVIGLVEGLMA